MMTQSPSDHVTKSPSRAAWVFVWLLLLAVPAVAQSRLECSSLASKILKRNIPYCVLLPPSYDTQPKQTYPILYFLHGLGDNERSLLNTGAINLIDDLRAQHQIGDFLIATPAGGRTFYIDSAEGKVRYSQFFLKEFLPYIEGKYRFAKEKGRAARAISGMSMGGYGALRFAFARPDLFSSVSAESAALITDPPAELDRAIRAGTPLGALLGPVFGGPIDVAHWNANNPILLAHRNRAQLARLRIAFNCGDHDDYGFEAGASALDAQLTRDRIAHDFHLYPGGHNLPYFLSHFAELMIFHWQGFDTKSPSPM
jgi:S-formylglutathione hydrolase FrmB